MVCRCQRQTRAQPEVFGGSHPVLSDYQELVLSGAAPSHGLRGVSFAFVRAGLVSDDFSTVCRRQQSLQVQVPYRSSQAGLHLLVDSTGIKFLGEGEWKCKKHGPERRRQWRKLHIGIDAQTLQIRALCITSNEVADAAVVADLLEQIPGHESVLSLTGDGAYDTQPVYEAVIERGVTPVIPPRKNARMHKGAAFTHRNAAIAACQRLVRRIWKVWSGYHRRSLVETKMNCIKRLGERVMSRTFERQVNELHIRAAILNRFTELGCPQTVLVAAVE